VLRPVRIGLRRQPASAVSLSYFRLIEILAIFRGLSGEQNSLGNEKARIFCPRWSIWRRSLRLRIFYIRVLNAETWFELRRDWFDDGKLCADRK